MMTLEERYRGDPGLLEFYKRKLLIPGWSGELDDVELAYIKSLLILPSALRRRWGFKPSAKRFSKKRIREVARSGVSLKMRG